MNESTLAKAQSIRAVIRYLEKFKNATVVIYLDDEIIESELFSSHIRDIALLHRSGLKVVIIPGAKKRIDEVLTQSNITWSYKNNIRVTEEEAVPYIKMAAFDVSNIVMTKLAANNINALIGNWVRSRSKGIIDGFDYGNAGEIDKLDVEALNKVLDQGFIPIFPCIGWNSVGKPYNISSIALAQQVAINLGADKLFFVMKNQNISKDEYKIPEGVALSDDGNVAALNLEQVDEFIRINDLNQKGNDTKSVRILLEKGKEACRKGVTRSHIVDGKIDGVLPCEIFSDLGLGTMIYSNDYGNIRSAEQKDIPSMLRVMNPFVEEGKLLPRTAESISEKLNDYIVYEVDGGIHGVCALHFYESEAEIAAVAVEEKFSNMGIGPKMIQFLIEKAKQNKVKSVFILTTQAADWFEKIGFKSDNVETLPEERKQLWNPKRNSKLFRLNF